MNRMLAALLIALPSLAQAQWQLGGNVAVRTRPDDGRTLWGTQLEIMGVRLTTGPVTHFFTGSVVQIRNENSTGGAVRENSVEVAYLYRRALRGAWGAAVGPTVGYSTGCASGGTGGITYGSTSCLASFTTKGTTTPGYIVQLDWAKTTSNGVSWRWGVRGTGHTPAAGSVAPKPSVWAGFTAPLGQ
jgi:hypothetical protein